MAQAAGIVIVAAVAANGVIGAKGGLPWHIPEDFRRVKRLTMGKPLVMGRRTFESLPGLLPGRRHIVITRDRGWRAEGAEPAPTLDAALAIAAAPEIIIFGGAAIYALALPRATRIELTEVHAEVDGDTHMPALGPGWREIAREEHAGTHVQPGFAFVTLIRTL